MPAVLADLSRTLPFPTAVEFEEPENEEGGNERVSARGLEMLRVLNEVFNEMPATTPANAILNFSSPAGESRLALD